MWRAFLGTIAVLGHEVRLIHPNFVRPFVKTNDNDWNDAAAICEAAQRPTIRYSAGYAFRKMSLSLRLSLASSEGFGRRAPQHGST
jgi:transposase